MTKPNILWTSSYRNLLNTDDESQVPHSNMNHPRHLINQSPITHRIDKRYKYIIVNIIVEKNFNLISKFRIY